MDRLSSYLIALSNFFLLSWGWRRRFLCVFLGAFTALALPPYDAYFALLLSFSALVWILDGALEARPGKVLSRFWTGFGIGWLFGFGYFLTSLWWIGSAFLVEADRFAWLMPFAVLTMPIGLAIFSAFGVAIAGLLWSERISRILVLAASLTLLEWVRGHVFSGFPWNTYGYGVSGSLALSQNASLFGVYGLTFLVVAVSSVPAVLADMKPKRERITALFLGVFVCSGLLVFGLFRLSATPTSFAEIDIRVIQPSIKQEEKWLTEKREDIFQTLLDMTSSPGKERSKANQRKLVVWPESAVPFLLTQSPNALFRIGEALGESAELVTGAIRSERAAYGNSVFNSVYSLDSNGMVKGVYDKVRLVPFGEYLPFETLLNQLGVANLAGPIGGFEAGYRTRTLSAFEQFSFLPLICYEVIFPGLGLKQDLTPSFLLNVTNDAWFGRTPGPYQHFAQARMRAIETGLPLVRAANTGISAIVDPLGREIEVLEIFEIGVIDAALPKKLDGTTYRKFANWPVLALSLLILAVSLIQRFNRSSR